MEIIYLLIPVALLIVVIVAVLFFWSIRSGQFDDLEGPAHRILMDDDDTQTESRTGSENQHDRATKEEL